MGPGAGRRLQLRSDRFLAWKHNLFRSLRHQPVRQQLLSRPVHGTERGGNHRRLGSPIYLRRRHTSGDRRLDREEGAMMTIRNIGAALAGVAALALSACGGGSGGTRVASTPTPPPSPPPPSPPAGPPPVKIFANPT